jgi:hypothetical protein
MIHEMTFYDTDENHFGVTVFWDENILKVMHVITFFFFYINIKKYYGANNVKCRYA